MMNRRHYTRHYTNTDWQLKCPRIVYVLPPVTTSVRFFTMDRMQNSAPSWITGVRHLESSFASFANNSIAKYLYMHINTNPSEVCSVKL